MRKTHIFLFLITLISGFILQSCRYNTPNLKKRTVHFAAYTVPREVYSKKIIPDFIKMWRQKHGEEISFNQSYMGSGAMSRTIISGLKADIAALSLKKDIDRLKNNNLIKHNWQDNKFKGYITNSVVVIAYRPGNPKNIQNWDDLEKKNLEILYPSPRTSGGAMWIINAIYGKGLREKQSAESPESRAKNLLKCIQKKVRVMDKSGRSSVTTYENNIGDILFTYENEALLRKKQGKNFPYFIPDPTILIQNPVALIDTNCDLHKNRDIVEEFLNYLYTPQVQQIFADFGFRPVLKQTSKNNRDKFPVPEDLFTAEDLGGWDSLTKKLYSSEGIWNKIFLDIASEE